jgi:Holliday junction resolvase RusA-like endonuclease
MANKYTIPLIPPSNNRFKGRQNHWEYRETKSAWEEFVAAYCRPRPPAPLVGVVTITYFFPTRSRHDPDNYNGVMILDGLVKAGIINDDSFECIELRLRGSYDKVNPRTEIEISGHAESPA